MSDGFEVGMSFRHRVSGLRIKVERIDGNVLWCSYPDHHSTSGLRRYEKHPQQGQSFGALHKIESLPEPSTGPASESWPTIWENSNTESSP